MPHGTRLYSIAASRYGDKFDGKTTTLCVRRATYWDSEKVHLDSVSYVVMEHHGAYVCASQLQVMLRAAVKPSIALTILLKAVQHEW
jgi:hypothetical protein